MLGFLFRSALIPRSVLNPRTWILKLLSFPAKSLRPTSLENLSVGSFPPNLTTKVGLLLCGLQPFLFFSKESDEMYETFLVECRQAGRVFEGIPGPANLARARKSTARISARACLSKFLMHSVKLSWHTVASYGAVADSFLFTCLSLTVCCFLCLKTLAYRADNWLKVTKIWKWNKGYVGDKQVLFATLLRRVWRLLCKWDFFTWFWVFREFSENMLHVWELFFLQVHSKIL